MKQDDLAAMQAYAIFLWRGFLRNNSQSKVQIFSHSYDELLWLLRLRRYDTLLLFAIICDKYYLSIISCDSSKF